uniref:Putative ovule protein n=1 Tax=Solanum chacoense TaxID=4108 RepID=A0A0V0IEX3_SOLCH
MVSRMEGRVEQVETNLTGVREDVRKLEGWFQEMTETLARIEAQGRTVMAEASLSQTRSIGNQKEGSNVNLAREKYGKEISGTTTTSFRRRGSFRMDLQSGTVFCSE